MRGSRYECSMMRWLMIASVVAACGKSADECRVEAETLSKLLMETPHEMGAFYPQRDVTLVKRADPTVTAELDGPVVVANADTTTFEGTLSSGDDLRDRLEMARARKAVKGSGRIYFQLDRLTPWSKVVQLVDTAKLAGFKTVGFAFETGEKLTPPPRTPVDAKLDELMSGSGANKAVELVNLIVPVVESCPALQKEFGKVGVESTGSKADSMIKGLALALIECKCNVDMPALRSVMWRLLAVDPAVKVVLVDATTGDKLALPGATTWEDASKKLVRGRNYQLTAE